LDVSTVRAELVEAPVAFRQTQGERLLKFHKADESLFKNVMVALDGHETKPPGCSTTHLKLSI
jgi:hypothetical protein